MRKTQMHLSHAKREARRMQHKTLNKRAARFCQRQFYLAAFCALPPAASCASVNFILFGQSKRFCALPASALKRLYFLMIINNLFMPHRMMEAALVHFLSVRVCGTKSFKAILMLFAFSTAPCAISSPTSKGESLS